MIPPNTPPKAKRTQWTKEEYKTILRAFYIAQENPITNLTEQTLTEWMKVDSNKLANVRRDIIRNKRLTDTEIDQIRTQIRNEENVTSDEEEKQHFIENMNLEPIVLIPQLDMNKVRNRIAEVRNASLNDEDPKSQDNFTEQYSQEIEEARLDILREFSRIEHQDFSERDPPPKITNSAKLNLKIKLYNVALKKILMNKECDLSNLNNNLCYWKSNL